jgi:Tfp pilus assembly protein PilN
MLSGATDADVIAFVQTEGSALTVPAVLLGHPMRSAELSKALAAHGMRTQVVDLGLPPEATAVELFAVAGTLDAASLPLRSAGAQRLHASRMRATTRWLAAGAVAALLLAFALDRWRVQRALSDVQRARAEVAGPVSTAMAARGDLENAAEVAGALAQREANASRVSGVLAAVAVGLPSGATLTAMHVVGDSITVEGESARSAAVYDALRAMPVLEQVKLAAPLRQERQAGDVAVEHFAFSARLRPSSNTPARASR